MMLREGSAFGIVPGRSGPGGTIAAWLGAVVSATTVIWFLQTEENIERLQAVMRQVMTPVIPDELNRLLGYGPYIAVLLLLPAWLLFISIAARRALGGWQEIFGIGAIVLFWLTVAGIWVWDSWFYASLSARVELAVCLLAQIGLVACWRNDWLRAV